MTRRTVATGLPRLHPQCRKIGARRDDEALHCSRSPWVSCDGGHYAALQQVGFQLGPRQHWLVGLMGLFPAWLIAFLGLLPSSVGSEYNPLPRSALLSSVVALLGVVFTDTAVRRLDKSGYSLSSFKYWILEQQGSFRRGLSLCGFSVEQRLRVESL